jgi:putative restriction endonuclease
MAGDHDVWLERVKRIRRWVRGNERAPHKPLLLLYALGRLQRTGSSRMRYADAEPELQRLLDDFGPAERSTKPAYPFHYLRNDDRLWVVEAVGDDPGPSDTALRARATGRLHPDFEATLRRDSELAVLIARYLLDDNFPPSLHEDICTEAGFDLDLSDRPAALVAVDARPRDPEFRDAVLVAYEYRCSMCGYDGRLGTQAVALDAAHVQWRAHDGPDKVENSLCLCSFHHKLFDTGVLGVTDDYTVAVSRRFVGSGRVAKELVLRLVGQDLLEPQPGSPLPAAEYVAWHTTEVFRSPARVPA